MKALKIFEVANFERGGNPLERLKIGKADLLRNEERLDELSIEELITLVSDMKLVTREGYGGENQYGFLPEYVDKRIHKEAKQMPNSSHTYDTWDSYSLYKIISDSEESKKAIMYISVRSDRGSCFRTRMVNYKEEVHTEYVVDWDNKIS